MVGTGLGTVETMAISALADAPEQDVLALNNAHAAELSWLEPDDLRHLIAEAFYAEAVGGCDAILIAFDQDADYASPNFQWFRARYPRFVYVDRVVVSPVAEAAAWRARSTMICSIGLPPPAYDRHLRGQFDAAQPAASDAFHAALSFLVVGSAAIHDGKKSVRYYARDL